MKTVINEHLENLTLKSPDPEQREKINLNFYYHSSSRCFQRFYEGLKGLQKTF